jgi:cell division septum initiation protein DivIVA
MNMIDGTLNMSGTYDSRNVKEPKIDFDLEMLGFGIDKMFETFNTIKKLAPIAENCDGLIDLTFNLNAILDQNMEPIQESMNGAGRLKSKDITVGGSDAFGKLAKALKNDKYKEANISDINANFVIENGDIIISPFDVMMNDSKATFGGRQGVDQSLDYLLNLNIPRSDLGDANKLIDGVLALGGDLTKNVNIGETIKADIFITGTVDEPKFSVGMKDLANDTKEKVEDKVKEQVKEVIDDSKEKAIAEAKKQADALMAEADKKSQELMAEANKQADNIRKNGKKAADQAKAEAKKEIDKLVKDAGSNPIAKAAAKKAGEKLQKEADKKADRLQKEANTKADQLVAETKKQTDNIKQTAKAEGDKLIADAEKL